MMRTKPIQDLIGVQSGSKLVIGFAGRKNFNGVMMIMWTVRCTTCGRVFESGRGEILRKRRLTVGCAKCTALPVKKAGPHKPRPLTDPTREETIRHRGMNQSQRQARLWLRLIRKGLLPKPGSPAPKLRTP